MTHLRAAPSQHDFSLHGAASRMGVRGCAISSTGKREQVMSWQGLHNHAERLLGTASRACAAVDHPPNALASRNVLVVVASISALLMTCYPPDLVRCCCEQEPNPNGINNEYERAVPMLRLVLAVPPTCQNPTSLPARAPRPTTSAPLCTSAGAFASIVGRQYAVQQ